MLRRTTPKRAGLAAIVAGVVVAVGGGILITVPPLSIVGALVLVAATVLVSVGCVWLLRRDWDEPWPPDVRPDLARQLHLRRVLLIASGVLLPVALGWGVFSAIRGEWWTLVYSLFLSVNAVYNLSVFRKLGALAAQRADSA